MDKLQILQKLTVLVKAGTSKADIEREAQLPKNSLSSVLTGVKEMPNKWVEKFVEYFERLEIQAEGEQQVQTVVNTLLSTGIVKRSEGTSWQRACLISQEARDIQEFCEKKGFPPSELIEKFEGLEAFHDKFKGMPQIEAINILNNTVDQLNMGQNKANTAPNPGKEGKTTPKDEKGKGGAENKPVVLSNFLKSRQNLKNGMK